MTFQKIILVSLVFIFISCDGGSSGLVVSGKVQGLDGTLIIQNNGKDDITIEKDGTFSFNVTDKSDYNIEMFREPCAQRCEIKNGKGIVENKSVENIDIICLAKTWTNTQKFLAGTEFSSMEIEVRDIAMNKKGDVIVIWNTRRNGTYNTIMRLYKSEYFDGKWHHPLNSADSVSLIESFIMTAHVAMNNDRAVIVWDQQKPFDGYGVYKSEYKYGVWEKPTLISDQINITYTNVIRTNVAMDINNNIIITWTDLNYDETAAIYMSEYRNGIWSYPKDKNDKLNVGTEFISRDPLIAMNSDNEAIIVWGQFVVDGPLKLYKSEYFDDKWHHPHATTEHFDSTQKATLGSVAMNDLGNILVAWTSKISDSKIGVVISERKNHIWEESNYINPEGGLAAFPIAKLSENGDAIVVWNEGDESNTIYYNSTFKTERRNEKWDWPIYKNDIVNQSKYLSFPNVDMDNYGNTLIGWKTWTGSSYNFLKKEYDLNHWKDIKIVGEESGENYNWTITPQIKAVECRKIIFWPSSYSSWYAPNYFVNQYR